MWNCYNIPIRKKLTCPWWVLYLNIWMDTNPRKNVIAIEFYISQAAIPKPHYTPSLFGCVCVCVAFPTTTLDFDISKTQQVFFVISLLFLTSYFSLLAKQNVIELTNIWVCVSLQSTFPKKKTNWKYGQNNLPNDVTMKASVMVAMMATLRRLLWRCRQYPWEL